jgi:hypothetical protein
MIRLTHLWKAYWALYAIACFGAVCFITGYWACTLTAIAMLRGVG